MTIKRLMLIAACACLALVASVRWARITALERRIASIQSVSLDLGRVGTNVCTFEAWPTPLLEAMFGPPQLWLRFEGGWAPHSSLLEVRFSVLNSNGATPIGECAISDLDDDAEFDAVLIGVVPDMIANGSGALSIEYEVVVADHNAPRAVLELEPQNQDAWVAADYYKALYIATFVTSLLVGCTSWVLHRMRSRGAVGEETGIQARRGGG